MKKPCTTVSKRNLGLCLLLAAMSAYAICARFTASQVSEASFPELLYLGNKSGALVVAVLFVVLFAWYRRIARESVRFRPAVLALSFVFAVMLLVGRAFTAADVTYGVYGTFDAMFSSWQRCVFTAFVFCGLFTVVVCVVDFLFGLLDGLRDRFRSASADERRSASNGWIARAMEFVYAHQPWGFMALFVLCWLPYLVVFFPGTIYVDGASQLAQYFGTTPYTGHHPLAVTLLFGSLVQMGRILGSDTLGVFFCTLLQTLLLAYACARIVGYVDRALLKSRGSRGGCLVPRRVFRSRSFVGNGGCKHKEGRFVLCAVRIAVRCRFRVRAPRPVAR